MSNTTQRPTCLFGVDPGKHTGWAMFWNGYLVQCGVTDDPLKVPVTVRNMSGQIVVVIEEPQIYRTRKMKGDPNDLIPVARLAGRYEERAIVSGAKVRIVKPADWKGQLKKEISHERIFEKLSADEHKVMSAVKCAAGIRHNMLDAIGIGLFGLGRS